MSRIKLYTGFSQGTSDNLPEVHYDMITEYLVTNAEQISASSVGAKAIRSTREDYIEEAIGYVQVKRDRTLCTVKARVTPEHRITNKDYEVEVQINTETQHILHCVCHDCVAAPGGCKHAVAFMFWLYERSKEPSVTSSKCYWKKSRLSTIAGGSKCIELDDLVEKKAEPLPIHNWEFADFTLATLKKNNVNCLFVETAPQPISSLSSSISLHHLVLQFRNEGGNSLEDFVNFCKQKITDEMCAEVQDLTRNQSVNPLWHECRYARITASRLYEVSRCKTLDGSLVEIILGAGLPLKLEAVSRGKKLEPQVLQIVAAARGTAIEESGIFLRPDLPLFAASPDGIAVSRDCIFEVKCPIKKETVGDYLNEGRPTEKPFAQMQLQMHMSKIKKCIFCVAHPTFETTNRVEMVEVAYDEHYVENLMKKCLSFYEKAIWPRILMR